jgi:hypothetical protein
MVKFCSDHKRFQNPLLRPDLDSNAMPRFIEIFDALMVQGDIDSKFFTLVTQLDSILLTFSYDKNVNIFLILIHKFLRSSQYFAWRAEESAFLASTNLDFSLNDDSVSGVPINPQGKDGVQEVVASSRMSGGSLSFKTDNCRSPLSHRFLVADEEHQSDVGSERTSVTDRLSNRDVGGTVPKLFK